MELSAASHLRPSTALFTDHYELTMLEAALASGIANRRSIFEVFARRLPSGRRYGVVAGTGRLLQQLVDFRFDEDILSHMRERNILQPSTLDWLSDYRFSGSIDGYREGELYFPNSPILTVDASFAEALLVETLILSVLNHDSAIASAATRMVDAAGGRTMIEAGSRRTHEEAAVAAARAAYVAGFDTTSNLEAERRWGVPSAGTTSHAFVLAHETEEAAFAAQVAAFGPSTTFLVDTYDIATGIDTAIRVARAAGGVPAAIRIDSGDLAVGTRKARTQLDALGAQQTRIVVSNDLEEQRIAELMTAPIDAYMVGTQVVVGSGAPTASMVYKLVARAAAEAVDAPLFPVSKRSSAKVSLGGQKRATRHFDPQGFAIAENISTDLDGTADDGQSRRLQTPLMRGGVVVASTDVHQAREHCARVRAELRPEYRTPVSGEPALTATLRE